MPKDWAILQQCQIENFWNFQELEEKLQWEGSRLRFREGQWPAQAFLMDSSANPGLLKFREGLTGEGQQPSMLSWGTILQILKFTGLDKELLGEGQGLRPSDGQRPEQFSYCKISTSPGTCRCWGEQPFKRQRPIPSEWEGMRVLSSLTTLRIQYCTVVWWNQPCQGQMPKKFLWEVDNSRWFCHARAGGPSPSNGSRPEHKTSTGGTAGGGRLVLPLMMILLMVHL